MKNDDYEYIQILRSEEEYPDYNLAELGILNIPRNDFVGHGDGYTYFLIHICNNCHTKFSGPEAMDQCPYCDSFDIDELEWCSEEKLPPSVDPEYPAISDLGVCD